MSNKLYDILKWIAQILLPALGTLYFALAGIWNFPYGEQIVGTITATAKDPYFVIGYPAGTPAGTQLEFNLAYNPEEAIYFAEEVLSLNVPNIVCLGAPESNEVPKTRDTL